MKLLFASDLHGSAYYAEKLEVLIRNEENLPNFNPGDVLIHGHTHVRAAADRGAYFFLNPGSMALPKGDGVHSYMVYEDGVFTTKDMDGAVLETLDIRR